MGKKETHTDEFALGKRDSIAMPDIGPGVALMDAPGVAAPDILPLDKPLIDKQAEALQFNQEWLTIKISPSGDEYAPTSVFCMVNGRGAEVLQPDGRVMAMQYLPIGPELIVKRMYVEVLARSRTIRRKTRIDKHEGEDRNPTNYVDNIPIQTCTFTVLEDKNPRGREWLHRILASLY